MSSTPFTPFGALELLGIDPSQLNLEFRKEPKEESILQRTMVVIKEKNEKGEDVEVRQSVIEYLNDLAVKKFNKSGDLRGASKVAIAALSDLADTFSSARKGTPEKEFNEFCMKPLTTRKIVRTQEYDQEKGRMVEKERIETGADEYRKQYHGALSRSHPFDFISNWKHLPRDVRKELPEKLKKLKTETLTLTELTVFLDALKDNTGGISKEGVELMKAQMENFGARVMAALSMPDSPDKEKEIKQLREDFTTAFKMNDEGEFAKNGLIRHLGKASAKIEKYLKKIGRVLTGKDKAYQIVKAQRKAELAVFSALGEMLYGEKDPAKEMARDMEEGFAVVAREEAELAQTIEAAEVASSVQELSAEQVKSPAEMQAADPASPKEETSAAKPGETPIQTGVQQAQAVKSEPLNPPLSKEPASQISAPGQPKDKPSSHVGGLIWKFENLKHKAHEKSVSASIETGVKVSELRKKFEPQKPDGHPSSKRPGK